MINVIQYTLPEDLSCPSLLKLQFPILIKIKIIYIKTRNVLSCEFVIILEVLTKYNLTDYLMMIPLKILKKYKEIVSKQQIGVSENKIKNYLLKEKYLRFFFKKIQKC